MSEPAPALKRRAILTMSLRDRSSEAGGRSQSARAPLAAARGGRAPQGEISRTGARRVLLNLVGTAALRRPRRVQRRNDAARCFAGEDIAARCPYQSQVHGAG